MQAVAVASSAATPATTADWPGVSRVIAVGDIHGSYEKALRLLQGAEVIDGDHHWIGGEQHLVIAGDILDRGVGDRQLLDLMMKLQVEAEAAGGKVHVLLGNHEAMNLLRDLRYVANQSISAWAGEETKAERKAAFRAFADARRGQSRSGDLTAEFQRDYPPGYFARQRSFNADGEYGSWLLGLPTIVRIDGVVYVHGGLTVQVANFGVDGINRQMAEDLSQHLKYRAVLEEAGIVTPVMTLGEILRVAKAGVKRVGRIPVQLHEACQRVLDTSGGLMLGSKGPLWYRGNAFEDERIEREMLDYALQQLGARAMVVAHSPTTGKQITSRFHGKLYRVDHDIHGSEMLQALIIQPQEIVVIDTTTRQVMKPVQELPIGNHIPQENGRLDDAKIQAILAKGEVVDSRALGRGSTRPLLVEIELEGAERRGIFKAVSNGGNAGAQAEIDRYQHELAAYRLDRELGLNMVPVTVLRELDGQPGSLQMWIEGAIDLASATAYELELFKTDDAARHLSEGRIFDLLIGNSDRKPQDILCLVGEHHLFLIDHSKAFSNSPDITWAEGEWLSVESGLIRALKSLDRASLDRTLGDLLSEAQIEAVLLRRDQIVDRVVTTAGSAETQDESQPGPESSGKP